ncbi:Mitochondrial ribonuclease P catalytic subunit [Nymphon striatum]|nr:Mitochondrial ribonuclease P catalytic subunit [Nymphon striatum]
MLSHRFHKFVRLFSWSKAINISYSCERFMSDQSKLSGRQYRKLKNQRLFPSASGFGVKVIDPLYSFVYDLKNTVSLEEWRKLESDVSEKESYISKQVFECVTMRNLCDACCPVDVCQSFLEYIQNSREEVNLLTLAQFISYYSTKPKCDETLILKLYDEILARTHILDSVLFNLVISAICHTHRWKESIELYERMSDIITFTDSVYWNISWAAFNNNEPSIGWDYIKLLQKGYATTPCSKNLIAVINWCKRLMKEDINESKIEMKKLFNLLQKTQISISFEVYSCLCSYFERNLHARRTGLFRGSRIWDVIELTFSNSSPEVLPIALLIHRTDLLSDLRMSVREIQFAAHIDIRNWEQLAKHRGSWRTAVREGCRLVEERMLAHARELRQKKEAKTTAMLLSPTAAYILPGEKWNFNLTHIDLRNVTIGDDIFRKSTPQEMKRFIRFMESQKPFDIVIDGLNVFYSQFHKKNIFRLANIIDHVFDMGMRKILVIGREHILKHLRKTHISHLKSSVKFFISTNESEDDPFLLMAALISGPQTKCLSNDMLRNHKFLLNSSASNIFERWQQYNQIYFEIKKCEVFLKPTIEYMQTTQWSDDGSILHIPYCESSVEKVGTCKHRNWICIRRDV